MSSFQGELSYEAVLDHLNDGVYIVDQQNLIVHWNRGAERITGLRRDEVIGRNSTVDLLSHQRKDGVPFHNGNSPLAVCLETQQGLEEELFIRHSDGHVVPVVTRVSPIINNLGATIGAIEVFTDNSSKVSALQRIQELEEMALLCPLTEVGNRRYTNLALDSAAEELKRYGWDFGVLFVDIDHFKRVNDDYGHQAGDDILHMVAQALRATLRSFDFVGRWGGEEFVVILPHITDELLIRVSERCRAAVAESSYHIEGREVHVTISIGAVIANPGESPEECVARADKLMYQSKSKGRNRVTLEGDV